MIHVLKGRTSFLILGALVAGILSVATLFSISSAQAQGAGKLSSGATPTQTTAAAYIKFDGVDGEAQDKNHQKWSDVVSFNQSIHQPGGSATGATRRRGSVVLEDIMVTKELDKASPKLAEALLKGKVFPKVEIHLEKDIPGGRVTYYTYELKNVMISSYSVGGSVGEATSEDIALNFEEIKVTYTETDSRGKKKGNVEYTWKVEEGES